MGYTIHFDRAKPLTLSEWKRAVGTRDDVRLQSGGTSIRNPKTGEIISIGGVEGDAEVRIGKVWQPCFRWRTDDVAFDAPRDFDTPTSRIRKIALDLAAKLGARLVGQEGEEYR